MKDKRQNAKSCLTAQTGAFNSGELWYCRLQSCHHACAGPDTAMDHAEGSLDNKATKLYQKIMGSCINVLKCVHYNICCAVLQPLFTAMNRTNTEQGTRDESQACTPILHIGHPELALKFSSGTFQLLYPLGFCNTSFAGNPGNERAALGFFPC